MDVPVLHSARVFALGPISPSYSSRILGSVLAGGILISLVGVAAARRLQPPRSKICVLGWGEGCCARALREPGPRPPVTSTTNQLSVPLVGALREPQVPPDLLRPGGAAGVSLKVRKKEKK